MNGTDLAERCLQAILRDTGTLASWRGQAAKRRATVALPEAEDDRVVAAAVVLRELDLAKPILVGGPSAVRARLGRLGADPGAFEIVSPVEDVRREAVGEALLERRRPKGLSQGEARVLSADPLHFSAGLAALGAVDAVVAGADHATADVIRAGLYHVGLAPGISVVSGAFLLVPPAETGRTLLFADAAVIPEPDEEALVAIALASARSFEALCGRPPRVACLSFSTLGSADHPRARLQARVAETLRAKGLVADGELQFDAAIDARVAAKKAPESPVAGHADVFVFPSLESANIGYKIAQRLGGYSAVGPLVQGLARPVFDLSRGCSAEDVVNTVALAVLSAPWDGP